MNSCRFTGNRSMNRSSQNGIRKTFKNLHLRNDPPQFVADREKSDPQNFLNKSKFSLYFVSFQKTKVPVFPGFPRIVTTGSTTHTPNGARKLSYSHGCQKNDRNSPVCFSTYGTHRLEIPQFLSMPTCGGTFYPTGRPSYACHAL